MTLDGPIAVTLDATCALRQVVRERIAAGTTFFEPRYLEKMRELELELVLLEQKLMRIRDADDGGKTQ